MKKQNIETNFMEKIMRIWAKISSLVVIYWIIRSVYMSIKIIISTANIPNWSTPVLTPLLQILSIITSTGTAVIFYGPVFYYGWVKKSKNKKIKIWAKGLTIIFPLLAIIGLISPWGINFSDLYSLVPPFLVIIPLYYYAWRKK